MDLREERGVAGRRCVGAGGAVEQRHAPGPLAGFAHGEVGRPGHRLDDGRVDVAMGRGIVAGQDELVVDVRRGRLVGGRAGEVDEGEAFGWVVVGWLAGGALKVFSHEEV